MREDPDYPARFAEAESKAAHTLEDEAVRRAREGLRKAVRYKGKIVGYETEYSDTLLLELLRANNPAKFRNRTEVGGIGGGPLQTAITVRFVKPGEVPPDAG